MVQCSASLEGVKEESIRMNAVNKKVPENLKILRDFYCQPSNYKTILTKRPFATITFLGSLPSKYFWTVSDANAAVRI